MHVIEEGSGVEAMLDHQAAQRGAVALEEALLPAFRLVIRSEEHTSELQSLMRISYAVFCLKKKKISRTEQRKKQNTDINHRNETQQYINKTLDAKISTN